MSLFAPPPDRRAARPTLDADAPHEQARALVSAAAELAQRVRTTQRLARHTDRKATMYLNMLARHIAKLLGTTPDHGVPVLRVKGPGASVTHYVVRRDDIADGVRFVTAGSDGRLRLCVLDPTTGARRWTEYDGAAAPEDLPVEVMLEQAGALLARLEQAVRTAERATGQRAQTLDRTMTRVEAARAGDVRAQAAISASLGAAPAPAAAGTASAPVSAPAEPPSVRPAGPVAAAPIATVPAAPPAADSAPPTATAAEPAAAPAAAPAAEPDAPPPDAPPPDAPPPDAPPPRPLTRAEREKQYLLSRLRRSI